MAGYDAIFDPMRERLAGWKRRMPENFYNANANLGSALGYWLGEERLRQFTPLFARTGADAATMLNEWAIETNRDENLPRLRRFDALGERTEAIDFHPLYHEMGRKIYGSGIMSMYSRPGNDVAQLALFYLFMHNGEAGHCCPLACTAGAIKLLGRVGSPEIKDRYLPKLLDPNYDTHLHACQFLTELQGGSDVGANATVAVKDEDGNWRLHGEKWFCSVMDAGLMVLTARPEGAPPGTKGLAAFVAPRILENGRPNHFTVKRLKSKIGTRSMATGEVDLDGLIAYPVGNPGEGFKYVVDIVLNTSRLYNGFAAAGMTNRAYWEALSFAATREAFGQKIIEFPLVKRSIALLRAEAALQLSSSLHVADLAGRISCSGSEDDYGEFRFLVNANKYWTAVRSTQAIREAIEVLGGNGTIEEFSILPRLYRDAIVIESWEGTHNVLCQQLLRDMARYQVHLKVLRRSEEKMRALTQSKFAATAESLSLELASCRELAGLLLQMSSARMQLNIRPWVDRAMAAIQAADLLSEADAEAKRGEDTGKAEIVAYQLRRMDRNAAIFADEDLAKLEEILAR